MHTAPLKEPAIQKHRQDHRIDRIGTSASAKRIFDVVSALVALVIAGPFLCWFAARRRIFGREVLTRTERVGKYGRRFIQYGLSGVSQDRLLHDLPVLLNILA